MRMKSVLSFFLLLLLAFPAAGLAKDKWISISPMAFSTQEDISTLIYKNEIGGEAYLTLETTWGHVWAPVNFPNDAGKKDVILMEARVYDNYDNLNPTQTMDWAALAVSLVKVDFETGQIQTVMRIGTGFQGAPGHTILSSTYGVDTEIDNEKYSWYLRYTVELQYPSLKDELRLYGVRISYK